MSSVRPARLFWLGVSLFVASRVVVRLSGASFDLSALGASWQHLDPVLLQTRLLESLVHLHTQPPVFNAFLGLVLKAAGGASGVVFELIFLALGAALYLVTYLLMRRLSVSPRVAFAVSTVFALSPSVLLYELWLFYTLPLALLVGLLGLTFARSIERRSWGAYGSFFTVLALLCGLHGIFHLIYFAGCIGALLLACRGSRIKVLAAALVPFALVVGIYAKNAVLFGQFTTSTWLGMNVALRRVEVLPLEERKRLVADGQLSEVALVTPFDPLAHYPARYAQVPARFAAIPALANAVKSTGEPNLNHIGYIAIAKSYQADTKQVLRHHPKVLVQSLLRGWYEYFKASSNYWFLERNLKASWLLHWSNRLFDLLFYGVLLENTPGLLLIVFIPAMVVYALRVASKPGLVTSLELSSEQRWLLAFAAGTIAFVAVVANTLNTLENMRIRFMTDPLLAAILAFWIERWLRPHLRASTLFRARRG